MVGWWDMELTFFPEILQNYIYMWHNSHRTSTECWQKTSSFQKGKNTSTYLSRAKEKRKNIYTKELEPLGGSCEGRKVSNTMKSPHWQRQEAGSFGASEESAVCRGQNGKSCTESQCLLALSSLRYLFACPPGQVGTEC